MDDKIKSNMKESEKNEQRKARLRKWKELKLATRIIICPKHAKTLDSKFRSYSFIAQNEFDPVYNTTKDTLFKRMIRVPSNCILKYLLKQNVFVKELEKQTFHSLLPAKSF